MDNTKTWLVGATWGSEDLFDQFISEGQWTLGWTNDPRPDGRPDQFKKAQSIQPGDNIVIKKLCGSPSPGSMRIRARGIVLNTLPHNGVVRCEVQWKDVGNEYIVNHGGCTHAVNGPYKYGAGYDAWLHSVLNRPRT